MQMYANFFILESLSSCHPRTGHIKAIWPDFCTCCLIKFTRQTHSPLPVIYKAGFTTTASDLQGSWLLCPPNPYPPDCSLLHRRLKKGDALALGQLNSQKCEKLFLFPIQALIFVVKMQRRYGLGIWHQWEEHFCFCWLPLIFMQGTKLQASLQSDALSHFVCGGVRSP